MVVLLLLMIAGLAFVLLMNPVRSKPSLCWLARASLVCVCATVSFYLVPPPPRVCEEMTVQERKNVLADDVERMGGWVGGRGTVCLANHNNNN